MDKTSSRLDKCHSKWDFSFFYPFCLWCEHSDLRYVFLLSAYLFLLPEFYFFAVLKGEDFSGELLGQKPTLDSCCWFLNANVFEYASLVFRLPLPECRHKEIWIRFMLIMKNYNGSLCFISLPKLFGIYVCWVRSLKLLDKFRTEYSK